MANIIGSLVDLGSFIRGRARQGLDNQAQQMMNEGGKIEGQIGEIEKEQGKNNGEWTNANNKTREKQNQKNSKEGDKNTAQDRAEQAKQAIERNNQAISNIKNEKKEAKTQEEKEKKQALIDLCEKQNEEYEELKKEREKEAKQAEKELEELQEELEKAEKESEEKEKKSQELYDEIRELKGKQNELEDESNTLKEIADKMESGNIDQTQSTNMESLNQLLASKSGEFQGMPTESDIKEAFKDFIRNRALTLKQPKETGDIDGSKLPTYFTGDIFAESSEETKGVRIIFYIDNTGSMQRPFSRSTKGRQYKGDILKEIFKVILDAIEEDKENNKVEYMIKLWGSSVRTIKEYDDTLTPQETLDRINFRDGETRPMPVVEDISELEVDNTKKHLVLIMTDGEFQDYIYDDIEKNPPPIYTTWIGIGFKPRGSAGKRVLGNFVCEYPNELYDLILNYLIENIDVVSR